MKEKTLKLSKYFELRHPAYKYILITPHKSIRNYNSINIAKAISHTYKTITKKVYKEQKKLIIETEFKISYIIDIEDNNTKFYFLVPVPFLNILLEKIKEIWNKATVEVLEEGIKPFSNTSEMYTLSYKKEDALSILADRKSNEPLNSILNVMEIMKDKDRLTIIYNFMPCSQFGWKDQYQGTMKSILEKKSIDKKKLSFSYIAHNGIVSILNALEGVLTVLNDFLGNSSTGQQESLMTSIMGVLERQDELSNFTKRKKEATILNTQIAIVSDSVEQVRKNNNAISVCQAFRVLDDDNELCYIKEKKVCKVEDYSISKNHNIMSCEEVGNFLQIPGRTLLQQFNIKHIKVEESQVPTKLQTGTKLLGDANYKGTTTKAYLENEYNVGNLPLALTGIQGSGKTSFMRHYAKNCIDNGESVIVIDFIKECELSNNIKSITPKDKLIEIDLSSKDGIQGLGYNEIQITEDMEEFEKLEKASQQNELIMTFIDSIGICDPLSSSMRRFLSAASMVVFVQGFNSIKNVVQCLQEHKKRTEYINNLSDNIKISLDDEIKTLKELDVTDRGGDVVGTRESKIERILDRVSLLSADFKLKYMYNKSLENNINLVECMEEGKVVLFKIRESKFMTRMQKNIIVTYLVSKIWLSSQLRGAINLKPLRTNIIIDEVFQAPTCLNTLEYILPQSRKFGAKFILSVQYLKQFANIEDTLQASGTSYMFLKGTIEQDFNSFSNKLQGFEWDDLYNLEAFHSLNLIQYSGGFSSFITKLPYLEED